MSFPVIKTKVFLPWVILGLLVAFYLLGQSLWLKLDSVPPWNDCAHHLANYRVVLQSLNGSLSPQQQAYYKDGILYAPAYYYFSALASLFFGDTDLIHIPVNLFFFALLLIAVNAAGKKLFGAREGITACLLLSCYPYMYGSTRIFLLELALCSLAALCVCFLLYSEELRKLRFTIAAAAVCLLGVLTKRSFLIYVAGPLVFTLGKAMARRDGFWKAILCILPAVIAFASTLFSSEALYLFKSHFNQASLYSPEAPWARAFYYFLLLSDQINMASLIVFIAGLSAYFFIKSKNRAFVLLWLWTPLLILTFAPLKNSKYSLPILPVIALISSWGLHAIIKRSVLRYVLLSAVLGYGIWVHFVLLGNIAVKNPLTGKMRCLCLTPYVEYVHRPQNKHLDRVQEELFNVLRGHIVPGRICHVGVASYERNPEGRITPAQFQFADNFIVANEWGMKSYVLRHRLPFIAHFLFKLPDHETREQISKLDLIVAGAPVEAFYPEAAPFFDLAATLNVPSDGSKIYIYAKEKPRSRPEVKEDQDRSRIL